VRCVESVFITEYIILVVKYVKYTEELRVSNVGRWHLT